MYRWLILMIILSACNLASQQTNNAPPVIEFAANISSAPYREGMFINIQVLITNPTGQVNVIQYAVDNEMIEQIRDPNNGHNPQFVSTAQWRAEGVGTRTLRVIASRPDGVYGEATTTITIVDANSPIVQPTNTSLPQATAQPTNTLAPLPSASPVVIPTNLPISPPVNPPPVSGAPQATFLEMQNVRMGPSTSHTLIGTFNQGESVTILAVSEDGNWLKVPFRTYQGWVYAPILRVDGNINILPREAGPPLQSEPVTMPTSTPMDTLANLTVTNIGIHVPSDGSSQPKCGVPFVARVTVQNTSNIPTSTGLTLIQNVHVASGIVNGSSGLALVPVTIDGNGSHTVEYTFTIDTFFGEEQRLEFIADANNEVAESNEVDNRNSIGYVLAQGSC
jgi:hypothetical protein